MFSQFSKIFLFLIVLYLIVGVLTKQQNKAANSDENAASTIHHQQHSQVHNAVPLTAAEPSKKCFNRYCRTSLGPLNSGPWIQRFLSPLMRIYKRQKCLHCSKITEPTSLNTDLKNPADKSEHNTAENLFLQYILQQLYDEDQSWLHNIESVSAPVELIQKQNNADMHSDKQQQQLPKLAEHISTSNIANADNLDIWTEDPKKYQFLFAEDVQQHDLELLEHVIHSLQQAEAQ